MGNGSIPVKYIQMEHGHVQAVITSQGKSVSRFEFVFPGAFSIFPFIVSALVFKDSVHLFDFLPPGYLFTVDVQVIIALFRIGVKMNVGTLDAFVGIPVPLRVPFHPAKRSVLAGTGLGKFRFFQGEIQVDAVSGFGILPEGKINPERIGMVKGELHMEAGWHGEGSLQFRIIGAAHEPVSVAAFGQRAFGGRLPALQGFRSVAQVGFL